MEAKRIIREIIKALKIIRLKTMCLDICRKEGLRQRDINILMAVISAESGWNTKAVNKNANGSVDLGLIQANSYWYIEKMKLLTEWEAIHNPKKCIEIMAKRYRKGKITDWSAYKNGSYRKFL